MKSVALDYLGDVAAKLRWFSLEGAKATHIPSLDEANSAFLITESSMLTSDHIRCECARMHPPCQQTRFHSQLSRDSCEGRRNVRGT